ncbi:MAG: hypothetical protein ABR520_06165, partial [Mycobacteriales bacterium]
MPATLALLQMLVLGGGITRAIYVHDNHGRAQVVTSRVPRVATGASAVTTRTTKPAPAWRVRASVVEPGQGSAATRARVVPRNCPTTVLPATSGTAARAVVRSVAIYRRPDQAPQGALSNPTRDGLPLTVLVRQQWEDWLLV